MVELSTMYQKRINMDFIARFIWQINKNGLVYMARRLKEFNIGSGQLPLLMLLYNNKDGLNQEEISQLLNIDKGATAKAVFKLLDEGYIERKDDPIDNRMYRIYLTKKANKNKDKLLKIAKEWQEILLNGFQKNDKTHMLESLKKMKDNSMDYK